MKETQKRLKRIRTILPTINSITREIKALEQNDIGTSSFTKDKIFFRDGNPAEEKLIKKLQKIDDLRQEVKELYTEYFYLQKQINQLENGQERTVIRLLYINHYKALEVAKLLNIGVRTVYRIRDEGIKKLDKIISSRF